jgi:hypothetical protein
MVELIIATTPFQIVVINTKSRQNKMQQHWTNYRNLCTDFCQICFIKCSSLGGHDEDGAQTIKWIHLNLQNFETVDYPLMTRINGLWSPY